MKKMLILIMAMMPLFVFAQAFDESADGKIEKAMTIYTRPLS